MDYKEKLITFTKSLYDKANRLNLNSKHVYKRIISSLTTYPNPIMSSSDLEGIKNIGVKTKDLFQKEIFNLGNVDTKKEENKIKRIKKEQTLEIKINDTTSKKKKYVPAYRSGAYAILKVLSERDGLSKHLISHHGNKYSNTEFNVKERNSAWNSIKTLLKKGLVFEDTKKYFLTDDGVELSKQLFGNDSTIIHEKEENVKLIIDSREMKSRSERLFFQTEFNGKGISCETKVIQMGDFIWVSGEFVLDYIIERKCGSDFCSSISDGRINEQKKRMLDCGITHIFYIIENLRDSDMDKIGKQYVSSHLASLKCAKITVIETVDIKETVEVISMIDNCVREEYKKYGDENNFLSIDDYIEKGTKGRITNVNEMFYQFLLSIHGLNQQKAEIIANKFLSFGNFMEISKRNCIKEELMKIETKEGIKIGNKVINSICELLVAKTDID